MTGAESTISVIADDKTVVVEGVPFVCLTDVDPDLHAIQWNPASKSNVKGHISRKRGESHGFDDYAIVAPYVAQWQTAKDKADAELAEAKRKTEAEAKAREEAETKAAAEREAYRSMLGRKADDERALNEVLVTLNATDHEVIKAAESLLADRLPQEVLAQRRTARAIAKAEKTRLEGKS